jgi:hypothetical protein
VAPVSEIERVKRRDAEYGSPQEVLRARMVAVLDAQCAMLGQEEGAKFAFRQSLIDLAAVSETVAESLPPPSI